MSAREYPDGRRRCPWAGDEPAMIAYHDQEWGLPVHDDRHQFELLTLEGAQAGLSWRTVLLKRPRYREVFQGFDPARVAAFGPRDEARLLADPGIIRNRQKVRSAITNARAFIRVQEEFGSFDAYLWGFVEGRPMVNAWEDGSQVPAETPLSRAISRDLKKRGFSFVGPTIVYAHLQSAGLVNDHLVDCFRYRQLLA